MQPHVQLERKDETTSKAADGALKAALSFLSPYTADTEPETGEGGGICTYIGPV